jgi:hypothetical protein
MVARWVRVQPSNIQVGIGNRRGVRPVKSRQIGVPMTAHAQLRAQLRKPETNATQRAPMQRRTGERQQGSNKLNSNWRSVLRALRAAIG